MYSFGMAKALSARADVLCVVSSYAENIGLWRMEAKINPSFTIFEVATYKSIPSFILKTLDLRTFREIRNAIVRFRPDILYSPFMHFWEKFIFPRISCVVKVKTYHDITLHKGENFRLIRLLYNIFEYKADKYVILSDVFKETFCKHHRIYPADVIVIPHASFNQYSPGKMADLSIKKTLIFFGRIVEYKGIATMLEALPLIKKDIPDIKLLIAGNGNIAKYTGAIRSNGDCIELIHRWIDIDEVAPLFSRADIVLLPYTEASQSGVIPLANAIGVPVIATNVGGLPAQVVDNVTGLIIAPDNPAELARAVCRIYSDENKLKEMKTAAYRYATENTWEKSAETLLDGLAGLYRGMTNENRSEAAV